MYDNGNNLIEVEIEEARKANIISQKILDKLTELSGKGGFGGAGNSLVTGGVTAGLTAGITAGVRNVRQEEERRERSEGSEGRTRNFEDNTSRRITRMVYKTQFDADRYAEHIDEQVERVGSSKNVDEHQSVAHVQAQMKHTFEEIAKEEKEQTKEAKKQTKDGKDGKDKFLSWAFSPTRTIAATAAAAYATTSVLAPGTGRIGGNESVHLSAMQDSISGYASPLYWANGAGVEAWKFITGIMKGVR